METMNWIAMIVGYLTLGSFSALTLFIVAIEIGRQKRRNRHGGE